MFTERTIEEQYEQAKPDDLRTLVVGAGIAGLTAAQLLRSAGRNPVLIERAADDSDAGYMLALMPMADRVIDDLGVRDRYRTASVPLRRYGMRTHTGRMLRVDSMADILDRYGDYRGIARGPLLHVLTADGCGVTFDSTVTDLSENRDGVEVSLESGGASHRLEFDLVIIADGIHSSTRDLIPAAQPVELVDTGWGGWVVWAPADNHMDLGEELWGAGHFLGTYPVAGEIGVFLGGPRQDTAAGAATFVARTRRTLKVIDPRVDSALSAVEADPDPYYWSLTDCRAPAWVTGRTVLLGDAAAGFLPTAGIGAGMAMESAWVLSRVLRHADHVALADLLHSYERLQRPRVQAAQDNSRQLARLMFRSSRSVAVLRELALRAISVQTAIKPIQQLLAHPPDPDAADAVRQPSPM